MADNSKENVTRNVAWRFFEGVGAQGVTFIVSMVIARILDPSVYGLVAIVTVFISISQVFVDSGFGNALIQKKEADDLDFSTVFYFNVAFCVILYILLFFSAPFIASFYEMPQLTSVLRVQSITILISGVKNIQQAYVSRNLIFKKFFFATLAGTVTAGIVGILMALNGFGVWALVAQGLVNTIVDTILLWITVSWRPKRLFSLARLKSLFSYGWKLLASKLIDTVYEDVRSLIIGKLYSASDLAFYNKGRQFPHTAVAILNNSIDSVLFPSMSQEQDNVSRVRAMASRSIRVTSYVVFPVMTGLAVCSSPIINLLLTSKWDECVPYMIIFCIGYAIVPVTLANLNAIKAIGRSDIYLKLEIIRKIINTFSLLVLMWFGPQAIAFSYLINCVINVLINAYPNKQLLQYGYISQAKDLAPAFLLSVLMGVAVMSVYAIGLSDLATLAIQIPLGVAVYVLGSIMFKVDSFEYIFATVRNIITRKAA